MFVNACVVVDNVLLDFPFDFGLDLSGFIFCWLSVMLKQLNLKKGKPILHLKVTYYIMLKFM